MSLQLHDTLSGETRPFVPLHDDRVGVYSCGPTVYGPAHIGNFRSFLFADLLVRHLRWRGWTVTWVMNITDIDDKIIRGAAATGETIETLAERYLAAFLTDAASLRMTTPDVMPRATRYIDEIVSLITTLLDGGHAYRTDDGSIFYRIASWPAYGRLARLDPEGLRVGERVEADEYGKDDVRDFALWKGPETGRAVVRDGDRAGPTRLAHRVLGDEHGPPRSVVRHPYRRRRPDLPAPRGRDRPERSGDRARPSSRTWLHCAHLRMDGAKMAKSTGNIARVGELLAAGVSPRALRLALISVHYRAGLNHSDESLAASAAALDRLDAAVAALGRTPNLDPTIRRFRARSTPHARPSAPPSTTTSTSRPRWPSSSISSVTSIDGSSDGPCRRPTQNERSRRSMTSIGSWPSCPMPKRRSSSRQWQPCSTPDRRRGPRAISPRPIVCATSSQRSA